MRKDLMFAASRFVDVVPIFTYSVDEALEILALLKGYDADDDCSRLDADEVPLAPVAIPKPRLAVPRRADRDFCGDRLAEAAFDRDLEIRRGNGVSNVTRNCPLGSFPCRLTRSDAHRAPSNRASPRLYEAFRQLTSAPGVGRAEALRRSMLTLIDAGGNGAHPANWAAFAIVGEGHN